MAKRKGISTGTTAQRSIEEAGHLRFNTTTSLLEYYDGTSWKSIDAPPTVASVSPTSFASDGSSLFDIVITGSGFSNTISSVKFIGDDGTEYTSASVTRDSSTQITAQTVASMNVANEPYDVKVENSSGLSGTLADALDAGGTPTFVTAAGSLGTVYDASRGSTTLSITIQDPDSTGTISTSISSGSLPAGATTSEAQTPGQTILSISGFSAVGSNTTSTFTVQASDGVNTSTRQFTITVNAPARESFTSSGTFSVPTGVSSVDVLVVAGGGGGGTEHSGGGGAGGLIYRPGFTVTPGGTVTVTVGAGGQGFTQDRGAGQGPGQGFSGDTGQDSVFGTLTAKGGGGGGTWTGGQPPAGTGQTSEFGKPGGSGGGGSDAPGAQTGGGSAIQPNQPGESGNYGFGNPGGAGNSSSLGGGGGGAGAAGESGSQNGSGGAGKAYTIADGSSPVYYAGGGGGGGPNPAPYSRPQGGQGGGGEGGWGGQANPSGYSGTNATANRGSGGGGGHNDEPGFTNSGGSGGSGIVIVQY